MTPRTIFEAMLFVGGPDSQPISSQQVAALMRGVRAAEIDEIARELNEEYGHDVGDRALRRAERRIHGPQLPLRGNRRRRRLSAGAAR